MDPYFINALLEHWWRSAMSSTDPSSPPMFFPARHALRYPHGLILYAPFYIPLRAILHPLIAYNATLFAVIAAGTVCLYALLRRVGAPFAEAIVLTTLMVSPDGWALSNPYEPAYGARVRDWIAANQLTGVCRLDIEARTMSPLE
jgi:hypothetical protein